jgi:hypothetical protein
MVVIAELIGALLIDKEPPKQVKRRVHKLIDQFQEIQFCFKEEA